MRAKGKVVHWDDDGGLGFVEDSESGERVFMHSKAVAQQGRRPRLGDTVSYRLSQDAKGRLRADNVRYTDRQGKLASIRAAIATLPEIFGVLFVVALVGLGIWGRVPWVVVIAYAVVSVVAFITYGLDKRLARKGKRRIAESTLLLLALLCGWPGALAAQRVFRHKTSKRSFQVSFWVMVAVNVAIFSYFTGIGNFGWLSQPWSSVG
ncbi:DUF1294 domain-containing protein [Halomonas halocynthiae]|uniref:DUF1294 domain-containing protein n=1 Tax=Halomonas halocynthiae TaxID=176290 RepID=UPI000403B792|nr:DUF1294 domain-containing protein [Halomonas halocynthiae]